MNHNKKRRLGRGLEALLSAGFDAEVVVVSVGAPLSRRELRGLHGRTLPILFQNSSVASIRIEKVSDSLKTLPVPFRVRAHGNRYRPPVEELVVADDAD